MTDNELIEALGRMAPETGSLHCLGCGHEHNCSLHGCAICRAAVERIRQLAAENGIRNPPNGPLTLAELRGMDGEPVWDSALSQYGLVDIRLFNGKGCIRYFDNWTNPRCLVPDRYYRRRPEDGTI